MSGALPTASIGIILCKSKNEVVAEYALRDLGKPVGISEYHLTETLPKRFREGLPTIEQLKAELKHEPRTGSKFPVTRRDET